MLLHRVAGMLRMCINTHQKVFPSMRIFLTTRSSSTLPAAEGGQLLRNFVSNLIESDIAKGLHDGRIVTRFPPEPNGYLHLGHAKSININFGLARAYAGVTHMRFDDTNPTTESVEYVNSILNDVRWLVGGSAKTGADLDALIIPPLPTAPWHGPIRHASDYFPVMYEAAEFLIKSGLAYVDHLSQEEMKEYRGTLTTPGKNSPFRERSIEENLQLFREMRAGNVDEGVCVLRAKIDMQSSNMNMRDPAIYRVKKASHPMTGEFWCIYPMYDFAHSMSDALEGITHSLCTLEFADHRPLYDWVIQNVGGSGLFPQEYVEKGWRPVQTEFSRLNMQHTVLSKRKLIKLVSEGHVQGWDDPRMPTICGMRRRGFPAEAIRTFCDRLGISKAENNIDFTVLEDTVRESLDSSAPRLFALLNPLKVTITNWPKGKEDTFYAARHPKHDFGQRPLPFTGDVFIDRADFFDTGAAGDVRLPKGYKRLFLGGTVRLKYAYVIRCDEIVRDSNGEVVELRCTYDVSTRAKPNPNPAESDNGTDMPMRAKGAVQWVAQQYAVPIEAVLYDRLFLAASPGKSHKDGDFLKDINPHSKAVCSSAVAERSVLEADDCQAFQFERVGYFCTDGRSDARKLRFNRIVTLRDTWRGKAIVDANATEAIKPRQHSKSAATDVSKATAAAAATAAPAPVPVLVQDILRVDMRVGVILSAVKHPEADNLYVEKIDCGDKTGPRTVISGLVKHIKLHQLVGKKVVVVCNLKPSKMRGIVSEGMILAASSNTEDSEKVELVTPPDGAVAGEVILIPGYGPPQPDTQLKSKSAQEVWKRVSSQLCSNNNCIATFNQQMLMTSDGPCTVSSLRGAAIR